jgi:hypothetical protein
MSEKQELIWVSKEFSEKWKKATDEKATADIQAAMFDEYIQSVNGKIRDDFKANLETIEEDAAIFTGLMLKTRQAFEKAKNEHLDASYALWEKYEDDIPSITKKTASIISILEPLEVKLKTINNLMAKINTYEIDKVISSISVLSSACGKQKTMIEFLIKNFKQP